MQPFEVITARDLQHAVALLAEHGRSAQLLAGGTDLLVDLKSASHVPGVVIDISRARDLNKIELTDRGLSIGALVTHTEIMRSPLILELCPVLAEAAHSIGAVQTRNLGTLGGNLVTGVPSMDSGPALFALDALVTLATVSERRQMSIAEFQIAPRKTVLEAGELLAEIVIPGRNLGKPAHFQKLGLRKGQALALVNVAAALWVDWNKHAFVAPRIALGAVAPTVMRARAAESFLAGRAITPQAMEEAGRIAATEAKPIGDFRAPAQYRRDLVEVLTRRALSHAYARAKAKREGESR